MRGSAGRSRVPTSTRGRRSPAAGARTIDFEAVRQIGLELPGVVEGTAWGQRALKVGTRFLTCRAVHKSAGADSIIVSIGFDERALLIAAKPETFYVTEHYINYPVVLVRLPRVTRPKLREVLALGVRFVTRASREKPRGRKSARASATGTR